MASIDAPSENVNGITASTKPIELAIELPHSPGMRINLHLTILAKACLLFLATSNFDAGEGAVAAGSFVYAMPDRYNPSQPMSTALYTLPSTVDTVTRMAKVLARRLQRPCYVGGSIDLSGAASGGSVEEETHAFHAIVNAVVAEVAMTQHSS